MPDMVLIVGSYETQSSVRRHLDHTVQVDRIGKMDLALDVFARSDVDLLVWEIDKETTENEKGLELLEVINTDSPKTQVLILTPDKDLDVAFQGMDNGAFQYIKKPYQSEELQQSLDLAFKQQPIDSESRLLDAQHRSFIEFEGIYSVSPTMRHVVEQIQQVAASDATVLITGETGTGKDLVAAAVHRFSQRSSEPYVVVNTGACPPELIDGELFGHEKGAFTGATESRAGRFEQADGGSLFLDELGTMPNKTQVSLLRLMENKSFQRLGSHEDIHVDVRVIGATNDNLQQSVQDGSFREDLFYRFEAFPIQIPPLRDREGDILFLAKHFLSEFNRKYSKTISEISAEAMAFLEKYPWPGNVRELKNAMHRAAIICKEDGVTPKDLLSRIENTKMR